LRSSVLGFACGRRGPSDSGFARMRVPNFSVKRGRWRCAVRERLRELVATAFATCAHSRVERAERWELMLCRTLACPAQRPDSAGPRTNPAAPSGRLGSRRIA
jgi:hypothetical protein